MIKAECIQKIEHIKSMFPADVKLPNVYILHGDLTTKEMNYLYNHPNKFLRELIRHPNIFDKIKRMKQMIHDRNASVLIQVDGGVNQHNVRALVEAGADVLVAGSAIFKATDMVSAIQGLKLMNPI